ncbi:hypothetical protein SAY86_016397 [Trapa natans]|uniref:Uncharacterized protein n=1 Tax=Trapa natans TaxID=22666 RepID=A0AAN7LC69_TRANT|nr:hypothetical protein SAY86_016397 [Trapa natans]
MTIDTHNSSIHGTLDPDFFSDFSKVEFRTEKDLPLNRANYRDSSSPTTRNSINYDVVSPGDRLLSLHLLVVIRSRLVGGIEELELALQNSRRKVQFMESWASNDQRRPLIEDLQPL